MRIINNKGYFVKIYLLVALLFTAIYIFMTNNILKNDNKFKLETVVVNDIVMTAEENYSEENNNICLPDYDDYEYTFIDNDGNVLYSTKYSRYKNIGSSIENRDTFVDVIKNNEVIGKVVFDNQTSSILHEKRSKMCKVSILYCSIIFILSFIYFIILYKNIIRPFIMLKSFASAVANGNFDLPLRMDKNNLFGAFTESFDIMREELKISKEKERIIAQSKKELVASLSHDIKTPVASIKAVSELMQVQSKDELVISKAKIIVTKADQIELLINNLFHSTLEEISELKVISCEEESKIIGELIRNSDFYQKVGKFHVPECIIFCDKLRLQQVFDNIINNSYKYASTKIDINITLLEKQFVIVIKDYGQAIDESELPLLCEKFYRGSNTKGKSGSGIGLYISRYFMEKMGGSMRLIPDSSGFSVEVMISIP